MKTSQTPDSNSNHAWMVPNKSGIECQVHKTLGQESWLCQCIKTICWPKAGEVLYHLVTQTASLGSGQLQSLVTIIELSLWQSCLTRIGLRVFLPRSHYRKEPLPFCWDTSFLFTSPNSSCCLKRTSTPLFSHNPPSFLCWYDSLLRVGSIRFQHQLLML